MCIAGRVQQLSRIRLKLVRRCYSVIPQDYLAHVSMDHANFAVTGSNRSEVTSFGPITKCKQNVCFYVYVMFSVDFVDYTLLGGVAHPCCAIAVYV